MGKQAIRNICTDGSSYLGGIYMLDIILSSDAAGGLPWLYLNNIHRKEYSSAEAQMFW